jgi:hypothetical protein
MKPIAEKRFLESLAAAAHDIQLEQRGARIYHFFDSDFLGRIIFGYRDSLNHELILASKSRDDEAAAAQRLLMGALFGQGIGVPPLMRALPPHLYEVRRAVGRPGSGDDDYGTDLTIDELGLKELLDELLASLDSETPDEVLARLLEHGPRIFWGVELLSGRWETRLGRVLKLGVSEPSPLDDDAEAAAGSVFDVMARYVGHATGDIPQQGRVSGLRDAMALTALATGVNRGLGHDPPPMVVRFYTETRRIVNAWRNHPEVRSLLSYDPGDSARLDVEQAMSSVLRTPEYYLIRALISDLGHPTDGAEAAEAKEATRVSQVGRDLADAVVDLRRGGLSPSELSAVQIGASTIGEYMAEVTDLSSYSTGWRTLVTNIPQGLRGDLGTQLKDVVKGEQQRSDALKESFRKQVEQLTRRTRRVAEFTDTYVHVLARLNQWSGGLRPRHGTYVQHVGLPRWGFTAADVDERVLHHLVDSYEEWVSENGTSAGGELATVRVRFVIDIAYRLAAIRSAPLSAPDRLGEIVALLGFLWHIDDFASVAQYGDALIEGIELRRSRRGSGAAAPEAEEHERLGRLGGKIENFVAAAKLSAAVVTTGRSAESPADALVARAHELVEKLDDEKRRFPSAPEARGLTQAYILFTAWLSLNRTVMAYRGLESQRIRQPALAKESLAICLRVLEASESTSPMHAWLLNLTVYIAAVARIDHPDHSRLATELMVCRLSEGQAWSYRFDDTLSYYYYVRAARAVSRARADPAEGARLMESARKDLTEAQRWLDRLPQEVDTIDVVAHRGLLRELEVELDELLPVAVQR